MSRIVDQLRIGWGVHVADISLNNGTANKRPVRGIRPEFVLALAAVLLAGAVFVTGQLVFLFAAAGATLAGVAIWSMVSHRAAQQTDQRIAEFVQNDAVPCFQTDEDGGLLAANIAADRQFGAVEKGEATIGAVLNAVIKDPGALVLRLMARLDREDQVSETVVARRGHVKLSVHRNEHGVHFWRLQEFPDKEDQSGNASGLPMLTVGRNGTVLFMNEAARKFVGQRVRSIDALFVDLPPRPGATNTVTTTEGARDVLVAEVAAIGGRIEYFLIPPQATDAVTLRGGFADLPVPLLKLAPDGLIMASNGDAASLLGEDTPEGMNVTNLMEGLGRPIRDWLAEAAEGRGLHKSEFLRLTRPDRETFVQVTLSRITTDDQIALFAVLNDATELKTLEAQFVQSQKMQAIGQLAGGIAHDFNNLLTAISGHCDLLLLHHDQGDRDFADLVQINQNANRAAALVGQLLAFSRKQTLKSEILDMRDTLSDLTHLLNRLVGEKVELELRYDPMLSPIRADKRQLEQVVMNLVVNARDAMPDGGRIEIATSDLTLESALKRDRAQVPPGRYVQVTVSDNGQGIPVEVQPKIFEPFYTTKRTGEGTGLGLSTVYGIVKQSGGYIFVESAVGSGSKFTLLFPIFTGSMAAERAESSKSAASTVNAPGEDGTVLLVEDEAPVRAFASRALQLKGFRVLEADCGEQALEILQDAELDVDIFVTDVVMPGLDGPSWIKKARMDRPDARVVFMSGYSDGIFDAESEEVPNSVFLAKPFSLNDLTETVSKQIVQRA